MARFDCRYSFRHDVFDLVDSFLVDEVVRSSSGSVSYTNTKNSHHESAWIMQCYSLIDAVMSCDVLKTDPGEWGKVHRSYVVPSKFACQDDCDKICHGHGRRYVLFVDWSWDYRGSTQGSWWWRLFDVHILSTTEVASSAISRLSPTFGSFWVRPAVRV